MRCESCGSAATVEIVFSTSNGGLVARPKAQRKKMIFTYSKMTAFACTDCGAVFRIRLEEPEKLKHFVDYSGSTR